MASPWTERIQPSARVFTRNPEDHTWRFMGAYRDSVGVYGLGPTWRYMGAENWGEKFPNMSYNYSYPTYNPLITTHEPPSRRWYSKAIVGHYRNPDGTYSKSLQSPHRRLIEAR